MEVLISKALIDSNISHDELVLLNNVLREYDDIKEETKNLKTSLSYLARVAKVFDRMQQFIKDFSLFIKHCYHIVF